MGCEGEARVSVPSPRDSRQRESVPLMWIIAGKANAIVLPEPVAETPTRFRPLSAIGHACFWIGVGEGKPAFLISSMR